jgi:hypothetical protein
MTEHITRAAFRSRAVADIDAFPYVLKAPLVYASVLLDRVVTVPQGFVTDLYSIPWWLQRALPRDEGHANAAAIVHDCLYRYASAGGLIVTQKMADQVLREAMTAKGLPPWRRWVIYRGLRLFGWIAWEHYRDRDMEHPLGAV